MRAYVTPPKFAEIPDASGAMRYYILFTDNGSRRRIRCAVEPCNCKQSENRFCQHKIDALREFQEFQDKKNAMDSGDNFNVPIADLLDDYKAYSKNMKIHSDGTAELVNNHLNHFWNFCEIKRKFYINDFNDDVFRDYVQFLNQLEYTVGKNRKKNPDKAKEKKNYSATTINLNLRVIRSLFSYAQSKKYINDNPLSGLNKPKHQKIIKSVQQKPRNILTKDEITKLQENLTDQWLNMFNVYIYTGCRLSELINGLTWDRVQPEHLYIAENKKSGFIPKWKIDRRIKMNQVVKDAIESQREWQKKNKITTDYVFSTCLGTPYSRFNVNRFFKKKFEQLNIIGEYDCGVSIHCFRHTFITALINANIPLPVVQSIAGHKNIKTTMIYYHQIQANQDVIADFTY